MLYVVFVRVFRPTGSAGVVFGYAGLVKATILEGVLVILST